MNLALPLIAVQSIATLALSHGFLITAPARPSASVPFHRQVELKINKALLSTALTLPETSPLAPHTFGGMVELGIIERFGEEAANRVLQSWRLLEMGYEHKEFIGEGDPETSACHQHAHSYVPGLNAQPFYPVDDHAWCGKLATKYKDIKREFSKVTSDMAKLEREGNNVWASALTQDASSYGTGWKTLVLMDRGIWDPTNTILFSRTAKAVRDSGAPVTEVFFASMEPHSAIQPHSDFTNFVVTSHLGLEIPESGSNKCRLTIGDETRQWINGEVMLFDTSIRHEAINESDQTRFILMLRVWHPDLTQLERDALQFIYDCLALPGLVSPDAKERFEAELQLKTLKQFPTLAKTTHGGFGGSVDASKKNKGKSDYVKPRKDQSKK